MRASGDHVGAGALTLAVYEHVGALSIGTQQDGIIVNLCLREPWELVDCFQELVTAC